MEFEEQYKKMVEVITLLFNNTDNEEVLELLQGIDCLVRGGKYILKEKNKEAISHLKMGNSYVRQIIKRIDPNIEKREF